MTRPTEVTPAWTLQLFKSVSRVVNSSLVLEDIFESLGEVLAEAFEYTKLVLLILDDSQNGIHTMVSIGADGETVISGERYRFAGSDGPIDTLIRQRTPRLFHQADYPGSVMFSEAAKGKTLEAYCVPLINKGLLVGVMGMVQTADTAMNLQEQALLVELSEMITIGVENAKLYWQSQSRASRAFLVNQLTRAIRHSLNIDEILTTAVQELGKVIGVDRCIVQYFHDEPSEESQTIRDYVYLCPGIPPMQSTDAGPGREHEGFERKVFALRESSRNEAGMNPFILNDVADCPPTFAPQSYFQANRILSLAVLPIMIRQELVGTLTLHQCQASRVWVADDIDLLRDIAEHLGVALQQAEIVRELEHRKQVLEHTLDELRQAQVHLVQSEKMAVLGQFVAGIAHEVNTPLGAMMSNTETIRNCVDRLQADPPVERRKVLLDSMESLLGINKMAGERIQEIVRNLRNFARLDESDLKEVDVHEGIDSVLLLMRSTLPPEITVSKDYEPRMPRVQCYPGLLNQVFMNLLVNAMHAVENRPKPSIGIKTEYLKDTNAIRTAISDNGIGIPPENLARIFDPGFTTKRGGVGTGLGLALCYKILDKHHGRIHVESTVGAGTTFFVELPVRQTS